MAGSDLKQVRIESSEKRVRSYFGGELLFDSINTVLVWNVSRHLSYFVPLSDIKADMLRPSDHVEDSATEGPGEFYDLIAGDKVAEHAVVRYPRSEHEALRDRVLIDWYSVDGWFEEDEEVFFHPRDPYHRVDICPSSRHIEVVLDGVTVADSHNARLLFETNSATRYYLPLVDIRMDLLQTSDTATRCPYKGVASYWSVDLKGKVYDDLVWTYKNPFFESLMIANYAGFYNEKMDIYVDGVLDSRSAVRAAS